MDKVDKFTKNKSQKKIITFTIIGLVLLAGAITIYKTYALYKEKLEFNKLQERVSNNKTNQIAVIIDGEVSSTIPKKEEGYAFESATCDNGATAKWDNDTWEITISNLSKSKTTCTLTFKSGLEKALTNCDKDAATCLLENSNLDTVNLAYDETVDNNLRYIGSNPNNYIRFNNELWRIIGVMNNIKDSEGNIRSHLKIIRDESIGYYYYYSGSHSNHSDDWTKSTLNSEVLNGTYYNGLTNDAKNMINSVVWNLGGRADANALAHDFYTSEREDFVYNENATIWTGKIGLMYPSDYGYAVGENVRDLCLSKNLGDYNSNNCYNNDWLYLNDFQWTLMVNSNNDHAMYITNEGILGNNIKIDDVCLVRPNLFLNSDIKIVYGNGSKENPYELKVGS